MIIETVIIHWVCKQCEKGGELSISDMETVGSRLRGATAQHLLLSPNCVLNWENVVVVNEMDFKWQGLASILEQIQPHKK